MSSKTLPKYFESRNTKVPSIGIGTAFMTSDISEVIYSSIKDGTRLIDTASRYGSEEGIGKGIKRAIDEGIVKREDLFITTKLGKREMTEAEEAIKRSLKALGVDYIDLYLLHWPKFFNYNEKGEKTHLMPLHKIWPIMESFVEKGYTKHIGVSNYTVQSLLNLLSFCKIKPFVNEVEFHPYLYQKDLKEFCDLENIKIISYYPLIKGVNYKSRFPKIISEKQLDLLNEEIIVNLAKKYEKTVGQIILNWHIHLGVIPIPGTANPERMKENLASVDFKMDDKDYELISSLDKQFRFCDGIGIYGIDIFA